MQLPIAQTDEGGRRSYVLSALVAKRREIAGELVRAEAIVAQLRADLLHIDATIGLIRPGYDLSRLTPKRVVQRSTLFRRGELGRYIRDVLRCAPGPLLARDMAPLIAGRAHIPVDDPSVLVTIAHETTRALCLMRSRGQAISVKADGREVLWQLPLPPSLPGSRSEATSPQCPPSFPSGSRSRSR